MLLPHEIRKKEFSLAMGGYARSEVKSYLEYIADNYEKLRRENDELSRRLDAAMEKLDQYHASEMAALAANVKDEEPASGGKTAAVAAILSSLQLEVDMISARIGEINAFLGGTSEEDFDRIEEVEEIEEIEPIDEVEEIPEIAETVDAEPAEETEDAGEIEAVDPTDEIGSLDEIEDETEELAVLDDAESELELLETVEDEVEETDADGVLVFELPVSVPVVEEAPALEEASVPEVSAVEEDIIEGDAFEEAPIEETFEFVEVGEPEEEVFEEETSAEEAPDESEPEQIEFRIPEDAADEPDADGDEAPEQVDIDDFITDFFDMDGALADLSSEEEEAPAEFVEFVTPEEEPVTEESVEIAFDESAPETTPETAPKKASAKRFHIKKKAAAPKEAEASVEPTEENLDEIIATFAEASESAPVEVKDSEPAEAEPDETEATEDDDLEAILRALKVQYDSVTATTGTEDEKFDMTDFDEFNYIFGDSSSKIDIVPEKNDINEVLYDE